MKSLLLMLLLLSSCESKKKKEQLINENREQIDIKNNPKIITCYLVSLDGEQEIYQIQSDSIYAFGKTEKLNTVEYGKFLNTPNIIYNKGYKYGCGVCTDEVDYKFVFDFKDKQTVWEIEPNSKLPLEIKEYFNLLINKYKEFVDY